MASSTTSPTDRRGQQRQQIEREPKDTLENAADQRNRIATISGTYTDRTDPGE